MAEKDIRYQPLDPDEKIMKEATEKLKTDPTNAELWFEKGMQHNWLGENEESIECFSIGLTYAPLHAKMHAWRGRKLISCEKYMMACSDLAIASAIDPYDFEAWYYQGVAAYLGGKYEHAKKCHAMALPLIKEKAPLSIAAAVDWYWMECMRLGEREEAQRVVNEYITADLPTCDGDYLCRTLLYKGELSPEGFTEKCMADIKNPERARSYYLMLQYGLANYYHYMGQDDKANPILIEIATSPDCRNYFSVKQAVNDLKERNIQY